MVFSAKNVLTSAPKSHLKMDPLTVFLQSSQDLFETLSKRSNRVGSRERTQNESLANLSFQLRRIWAFLLHQLNPQVMGASFLCGSVCVFGEFICRLAKLGQLIQPHAGRPTSSLYHLLDRWFCLLITVQRSRSHLIPIPESSGPPPTTRAGIGQWGVFRSCCPSLDRKSVV